MSNIRLAAVDLDGTLLHEDKTVSAFSLEIVERVLDSGVELVLASGRSQGIIPPELLNNPRIRYIISCNGALIWDKKEQRAISEKYVPYEDALAILRKSGDYDCIPEASVDRMMYVGEPDAETEMQLIFPLMKGRMHTLRTTVPNVELFLEQKHIGAEKLLFFFHQSEAREPFRQWIDGNFDLALTSSHPLSLEVNAPGVSKGSALALLSKHLNIPAENIFAIGDSENDGEMIAYAGIGVAMGNAEEPLFKLTDYRTCDNDSDGAALAMEKWILQNR